MRLRRIVFAAALVAALLVPATAAHAATAPWDAVHVTVQAGQGRTIMLIAGTLPDSAALPASVELAAPKGAELSWAGEVLGGDPSQDPEVRVATRTAGDSDIYSFTLTKARSGQIEMLVDAIAAAEGSSEALAVAWTPSADVPEVTMGVLVPAGSKLTRPDEGAELGPGPTGSSFYSRTVAKAKAGEPISLDFAYEPPAGGTPPAGAAATSGGVSPALVAVIAAALGAAAYFALRRRTPRSAEGVAGPAAAADESAEPGPAAVGADVPAEAAVPRRRTPARFVPIAVIALLVAGAAFAMTEGNKPRVTEGSISRVFLNGDACSNASFALAGDPSAKSADILGALQGAGAMRAEILLAENRVDVAFCDSQTSESALQEALSSAGLLAQ